MEVPPPDELNPELPDQVDAALQNLWSGSSSQLDNLLKTNSPVGGGVDDILGGFASGLDRLLPSLKAGSELDGLQIVRELGRGGMGVVYAARQRNPQRTVALKVLRPGITSDGALRRFELEAKLLSHLRHPGIAQIYKTGAAETSEGPRPYFVMELVKGRSLIEYADRGGMNTEEKLNMFLKVCEAVQHAHQRGVIHRDLKPPTFLWMIRANRRFWTSAWVALSTLIR